MARGVDKTTGQAIVLKHWRRTAGAADDEIREVWRQEIRQLHRLAGFPGAREYIVGLLDSSEEAARVFGQRFLPQQVPEPTALSPVRPQTLPSRSRFKQRRR